MATYISLTNELLRRLNEVTIDTADFASVRNVQALAKDAINSSVREILQVAQEWPFTLNTYTQTLVTDQGTYDFPSDYSSVDWETFYLKKSTSLGNQPTALRLVDYDYYIKNLRASDDASGNGVPEYVYKTREGKFGVSPPPNGAYDIEYRYWAFPADLSVATDVCVIPERFKHVIIDGAMMYMMRFRSNEQSAQIHAQKFEDGIDNMRRVLVDSFVSLQSTVIRRGR